MVLWYGDLAAWSTAGYPSHPVDNMVCDDCLEDER